MNELADSAVQEAKLQQKKELKELADKYFLSVNDVFKETVKVLHKVDVLRVIAISLVFFIIFSVIPVAPYILKTIVSSRYGDNINIYGVDISLNSIFVWWLICAVVSILLFILFNMIWDIILEKRKRSRLPGHLMPFCLIYDTINEINAYLINQRDTHLDRAKEGIEEYLKKSEIHVSRLSFAKYLKNPESSTFIDIKVHELIGMLSENYFWFKLKDETNLIVSSYQEFYSRIRERIYQGVELDKVGSALTDLMLYEYSKIKKISQDKFSSDSVTISDLGRLCLFDYASQVSALAPVNKDEGKKGSKKTAIAYLKNVIKAVGGLLKSSNIIVCFISWYCFLFIVFSILLFFALKVFNMTLDTTLLIGIFSAPFAGSVAIASTIYSKSK